MIHFGFLYPVVHLPHIIMARWLLVRTRGRGEVGGVKDRLKLVIMEQAFQSHPRQLLLPQKSIWSKYSSCDIVYMEVTHDNLGVSSLFSRLTSTCISLGYAMVEASTLAREMELQND